MSDLIRREDALEIVKRTSGDYATAFSEISKFPAVDAVEVVRCRQCCFGVKKREMGEVVTYCGLFWGMKGVLDPNGFCSYGKEINDAKID